MLSPELEEIDLPRRHAVLLSLTVLAAFAAAGCGGDSSEDKADAFKEDYKPLNQELIDVGGQLGTALQGAKGKTNDQLATQFDELASDLGGVGDKIADLEAPDDLQADVDALTEEIADGEDTLKEISTAARAGDPAAARTATVGLVTKARDINDIQDKLAEETGAAIGDTE